ncbi:hypothetical protein HDF11_001232 [Tunturiibacter psychrotolerans]|jgi:hypothetical protein
MPWRSSKQDELEIIDLGLQGTNRLHLASLQNIDGIKESN